MENDTHKAQVLAEVMEKFDKNQCALVEKMLSIMSNPVRFHILCALEKESFSVSELMALSNSQLSNISQQLKMMTLAGYIGKERQGKQIIYTLKDNRIRQLIHTLEQLFGDN
jgi:DNA-binding transcriptional ArsR family regulator